MPSYSIYNTYKCLHFEKKITVNNSFSVKNEKHGERITPIERSRLARQANIIKSVKNFLYAEENVLTVNLNVRNVCKIKI